MSKPTKAKRGGDNAAESFGKSFLSGIADELGLSNVFGTKAPWDFGSVKLGLGLLNWGAGEMQQAMGGQGGYGGAGGGAGSLLGGAMNMNLPAMFGGAPNVPRNIIPGLGAGTGPSIGPGNFQAPGISGLGTSFGPPPGPFQGGSPGLVNPQFAQGAQSNTPNNVAPATYHIDNSLNITNHGPGSDLNAYQGVQNSYQRNAQMAAKPGTFAAH